MFAKNQRYPRTGTVLPNHRLIRSLRESQGYSLEQVVEETKNNLGLPAKQVKKKCAELLRTGKAKTRKEAERKVQKLIDRCLSLRTWQRIETGKPCFPATLEVVADVLRVPYSRLVVLNPTQQTTIWIAGSYQGIPPEQSRQRQIAETVVACLAPQLARLSICVVTGKSDLGEDLCNRFLKCKASEPEPVPSAAIMLFHPLAAEQAERSFEYPLGRRPSLALVIGGGQRIERELDGALEVGMAVLPIPATGGAAGNVQPAGLDLGLIQYCLEKDEGDGGELAAKILDVIRILRGQG